MHPELSLEDFHNRLCQYCGKSVKLTFTRNRVSLVSIKMSAFGAPCVRLSHLFLRAPDSVIRAMADYLSSRSRPAWDIVKEFVRSLDIPAPETRLLKVVSAGDHYDLGEILKRVSQQYFNGELDCRITWARRGSRKRRARSRTIRYGTYDKALKLIRINPLLDDSRVPLTFVEYIVFHELLHAALPSQQRTSRWAHHHHHFRKQESDYPGIQEMRALGEKLIGILGKW